MTEYAAAHSEEAVLQKGVEISSQDPLSPSSPSAAVRSPSSDTPPTETNTPVANTNGTKSGSNGLTHSNNCEPGDVSEEDNESSQSNPVLQFNEKIEELTEELNNEEPDEPDDVQDPLMDNHPEDAIDTGVGTNGDTDRTVESDIAAFNSMETEEQTGKKLEDGAEKEEPSEAVGKEIEKDNLETEINEPVGNKAEKDKKEKDPLGPVGNELEANPSEPFHNEEEEDKVEEDQIEPVDNELEEDKEKTDTSEPISNGLEKNPSEPVGKEIEKDKVELDPLEPVGNEPEEDPLEPVCNKMENGQVEVDPIKPVGNELETDKGDEVNSGPAHIESDNTVTEGEARSEAHSVDENLEAKANGPTVMLFRNETVLEEEEVPVKKYNSTVEEAVEELDCEVEAEEERGDLPSEGDTIEIEGEPQIAENPFPDTVASPEDLGRTEAGTLEVDPFDPLSGEAGAEDIEVDGEPESLPVDESTNGFLEKVNSGSINSAQFMTAIIDLPERTLKSRGPYKKRRVEVPSDSDEDYTEEYEEYIPGAQYKRKKSRSKSTKSVKKRKTAPTVVERRVGKPRDPMFECRHCDFRTETIGELNIHTYGNHESENKPTFLDMAEATVAKLSEGYGTSRVALLKAIMSDYGHVVEANTFTAKRILNRSVRLGVHMGRLRIGVPGKKGANNLFLPTKDTRKKLVNMYSKYPDSLYVEDLDIPEDQEESLQPIKRNHSSISSQNSSLQVQIKRPRITKNSGGRPLPAPSKVDDDEICVVEEKLTPLAKLKAKAYANAKAALAKKLPAAFLKTGATKMVRIGPGGIVRSEGGQIVTTLGKLTGTTLAPITKKKAAAAEQEARHLLAQKAAAATVVTPTVPADNKDDDDDDITCSMCLSSFWYKNELLDHMRNTHNIEDPDKHLKSK